MNDAVGASGFETTVGRFTDIERAGALADPMQIVVTARRV
jgi:hypothetical protein